MNVRNHHLMASSRLIQRIQMVLFNILLIIRPLLQKEAHLTCLKYHHDMYKNRVLSSCRELEI